MLTICDESLLEFTGISSLGVGSVAWRQFDSYYYCYYYYGIFILRIRYTSTLPQILMIYRTSARTFFSYTIRSPLATSSSDLFIASFLSLLARARCISRDTSAAKNAKAEASKKRTLGKSAEQLQNWEHPDEALLLSLLALSLLGPGRVTLLQTLLRSPLTSVHCRVCESPVRRGGEAAHHAAIQQ